MSRCYALARTPFSVLYGTWTSPSSCEASGCRAPGPQNRGRETVMMIKSNGLPSEKVTVARFFEAFLMSDSDRGYAVKVKVSRLFHYPCRERSQ